MKIQANELMTGDWVLDGNIYAQVTSITCDGNIETTHNEHSNIELFEPIPINKEVLEKNGFVANRHVYPYPYYEYENEENKLKVGFAFPHGNKTSYKEPWVYIDSERVFVEHLPCMFVHQLQHALRLCGIEKEIVLQ